MGRRANGSSSEAALQNLWTSNCRTGLLWLAPGTPLAPPFRSLCNCATAESVDRQKTATLIRKTRVAGESAAVGGGCCCRGVDWGGGGLPFERGEARQSDLWKISLTQHSHIYELEHK